MAPLTCLAQQWDAISARTAGAYPSGRLTHGASRNHALYLHVAVNPLVRQRDLSVLFVCDRFVRILCPTDEFVWVLFVIRYLFVICSLSVI
jgi:hypothetical protein